MVACKAAFVARKSFLSIDINTEIKLLKTNYRSEVILVKKNLYIFHYFGPARN